MPVAITIQPERLVPGQALSIALYQEARLPPQTKELDNEKS